MSAEHTPHSRRSTESTESPLDQARRFASWAPDSPESVHDIVCVGFNELDARMTALYAAIELIQNERDGLEEQLQAAEQNRTLEPCPNCGTPVPTRTDSYAGALGREAHDRAERLQEQLEAAQRERDEWAREFKRVQDIGFASSAETAALINAEMEEQFEMLRNFAEACCVIIERSRNPVEEIASRLDDVRAIAYPASEFDGVDRDGHRFYEPRWSLREIEMWLRSLGMDEATITSFPASES